MNQNKTNVLKRIAVVGAGLGGLSAAIHLSLQGFEVALYEGNKSVGGRASRITVAGFTFDTGPTLLNYPWVFEDLFNAAGSKMEDFLDLEPVEPSIRFLWPSGESFQLTSDLTKLVQEFERVAKGSSPELFAFLADTSEKYSIAFDKMVCRNVNNPLQWFGSLNPLELVKTGLWRSLDRELSRFFQNRFIREALGSYGMYLGGSPQNLPGIFSILPYGEIAMGLWLPRGGIYALVQSMEKLALKTGVRILTGQRVKQIITRNKRVTGLAMEDGRVDDWPIIVSNVDVPTTQNHLLSGDGTVPSRTLKMTPSVMTFYWGTRSEIQGAGHHTIFMPHDPAKAYDELIKQLKIPVELPFYISIASKTDPSMAPKGCSNIFVLVPLPHSSHMEPTDWNTKIKELKVRIFQRLNQHNIKISEADIVTEKVMTPADWGKRYGLFQNSAFGAAHTLFQMGTFRYSNRDPRIEGLYYTGASTTPGTGLPMVVLSGKMTAERICEDVC